MIIWLAPAVLLLALVVYAFAAAGDTKAKVADLARVAFACALLVTLLQFAGRTPFHFP